VPSRNESDAEYAHSSRSPTPGPRIEDVIGPSLGDVDVGPTLPALPTLSDRQLAREADADSERRERTATRKAERKSAYDKAEDLVPRATGREGKMAERRAANEENKKFREKDTEVELDEGTLMGDSDPFKAAYVTKKTGKDGADGVTGCARARRRRRAARTRRPNRLQTSGARCTNA
jgi:hypothetical protein